MKTAFRRTFLQDVRKLSDATVRRRVNELIEQVEHAASLNDFRSLKKIRGGDNCYRLRVGSYRIGVFIDGDTVTFGRCLHRREIYRHFP